MREFEKFRKNQKIVRTCRGRLARLSGPQETQNAWLGMRAREFSAVFASDLRFAHKGSLAVRMVTGRGDLHWQARRSERNPVPISQQNQECRLRSPECE